LFINSSPALRRAAAALLAAGLSALAIGACGGSESGSDGAKASDNERDTARLKLNQCLRENGVEVPDVEVQARRSGGGGGGGIRLSGEKARAALEGPCKKYRDAAFGDISDEERQEREDAFQKFAQCMRDNGIDFPDTTAGGSPPPGAARVNPDDPDFQAAQEKCQSTLPRGRSLRFGGPRSGAK
jgi:hypothetical protein